MSKAAYYAFFFFGMLLLPGSFLFNAVNSSRVAGIAEKAEERIRERADECGKALRLLDVAEGQDAIHRSYELYKEKRIALYLFVNGKLTFWNNSREPVIRDPLLLKDSAGITRLKSGFYLYRLEQRGQRTVLALSLLKPEYELQNRYLSSHFENWTGIPPEVRMDSLQAGGSEVRLYGEPVFTIKGVEARYQQRWVADTAFVLFSLGLVLTLVGLLYFIVYGAAGWQVLTLVGFIVAARLAMVAFEFPAFSYESFLYDVRLYGNARSFLNGYLGDILLNAVFLLFVAAVLYFRLHPPGLTRKTIWKPLLCMLMVFVCAHQFNRSIVSLIANSTMSFDFMNVFNMNLPAFLSLLALSLNTLAVFILLKRVTGFFTGAGARETVFFFILQLLICAGLWLADNDYTLVEIAWPLIFSISLFAAESIRRTRVALLVGIQVIIISAITSAILNDHIERNQKEELAVLSEKLAERQDPVLESEFSVIAARIRSDESLANLMMILPSTADAISELLNRKYFNEYFRRYQVAFSLFDAQCHPLIAVQDPMLSNQGFFDDQITFHSDSTAVPGLFFNRNYRENSRYIGRIPLSGHTLYVIMEPKQFEELGSLPDLLLDASQQKHPRLQNFSYAVYRSGHNTSSFGAFNYPPFLPTLPQLSSSAPDYHHVRHRFDENTYVIISSAKKDLNYFFTFNSYILLFYSLVTYCVYFLYGAFFTGEFRYASLTRRIQAIIIILLFLAMSAVGLTSGRLVTRQFRAENKEQLREKTEIIINELSQLKTELLFDEGQKESVTLRLNEYSRLFNTDISLFDSAGFLFTTSQPRLYNLGLAAAVANPEAMWMLRNNLSSAVSITEQAGSLGYTSLYTPLYGADRKLSGFVNLPYFARQNDLVNELSGIISALVNVYVILFVISIVAGLILAGYITRPLRLIQQQIANISLGRKNEKIVWQSNDEIGRLITEYNTMLVKLEESANLLAQSERESAWREMARQVAHEIKNPLTPMKLNLQYLQHLMKSDPADFRQKFEKASHGIIEQIDALANIANEFSHFAKLPVTQLQTVNLAEVIDSSLQIFIHQPGISIRNRIPENEIRIKADRDQCLRVFNNILANAVEALKDMPDATIEIGRIMKDDTVVILIRDNGPGIDELLKPRIFTPNFTTKSTGSGLGLAMVKNIMEGIGGRIWFESESGLGTVFYLEFRIDGA